MGKKGKNRCPHRGQIDREVNGELYCKEKKGRRVSFKKRECQAKDCSFR